MWNALWLRSRAAVVVLVAVTILACLAVLVPPKPTDLEVAIAAANYLGGFLIAGSLLRQLRLDLTYVAPGLLMLAYLFIVFLLAQQAESHRTALTYLLLMVAVLGAVLLVAVGALALVVAARVLSQVRGSATKFARKVSARVRPHVPARLMRAWSEPGEPVLPGAADDKIRRRPLYVGVGFLTYGLLLTLRQHYLPF